MTHDELLAMLKGYAEAAGLRMDRNCWFILSDVVELHKPKKNNDCPKCVFMIDPMGKSEMYPYPCPTIQAIEKELT